jgi:hypothetical protein
MPYSLLKLAEDHACCSPRAVARIANSVQRARCNADAWNMRRGNRMQSERQIVDNLRGSHEALSPPNGGLLAPHRVRAATDRAGQRAGNARVFAFLAQAPQRGS